MLKQIGRIADECTGEAALFTLSQEKPGDWWEVEALYDLSFAPGRTLLSSYRLREDVPPVAELCRVARDESGILGGAIRYWPVRIGHWHALLLGPVAVHPTAQGEGLGAALIRDTVERARALEWSRVLLVGDEPYYRRFGFGHLSGVEMPPPTNPERILGLELVPGAWQGVAGEVTRYA
ncbi:GNAT family N-acetyltransferase [Salipiger bermudensis]|uniref:GNAT family N-acetyltransferase n=1 Tax=Salipiger bermudensis TaxID=344736 RepID=UPI001CD6CD31|nr:N-acetyltransferase [Salipiger bermudensis]MCA1286138.1 N-acetyltransferase [Salipiger bermudensis]